MDCAPGHKTDQVKRACKELNFDICMIPGGMTKYLKPLDISVNRSFKAKLRRYHVQGLIDGGSGSLIQDISRAIKEVSVEAITNGFRKMYEYAGIDYQE